MMQTVTKEPWHFSMMSGGNIPAGMVRVEPFYFLPGRMVKGKGYGAIMSRDDAKKFGLENGYLQLYVMDQKLFLKIILDKLKNSKTLTGAIEEIQPEIEDRMTLL